MKKQHALVIWCVLLAFYSGCLFAQNLSGGKRRVPHRDWLKFDNTAPRDGLMLEYLANNWHYSEYPNVDTWYDSSGKGCNASSSVNTQQLAFDGYGLSGLNNRIGRLSVNYTGPDFALTTVIKVWPSVNCELFTYLYWSSAWLLDRWGGISQHNFNVFAGVVHTYPYPKEYNKRCTIVLRHHSGHIDVWIDGTRMAEGSGWYLPFYSDKWLDIGNTGAAGWGYNYATKNPIRAVWFYNREITDVELQQATNWKDSL